MFGAEFLIPPSGVILAGLFSCEPKPPPVVDIAISATAIKYDLTKSSAQLQSFDIDTVSPYSSKEHTKVGGLTGGQISIATDLNYSISKSPLLRQSCLWFDKVTVSVVSEPTVYIANEYKEGSCRFRTTFEHEMKHVKADIDILNEFQPRLEAAAKAAVADTSTIGPFSTDDIEQIKSGVNKKIEDALLKTIESLQSERRIRQQAIDSREEYDRLSRVCGAGQF